MPRVTALDGHREELEKYLTENKLVEQSDAEAGVPLNAPCANEQHPAEVKLKL